MIHGMYQVIHASRSEFVPIRDQRYHVRIWGEPRDDVPPLVLVHGWMDVAASWQFMVDALQGGRWIVAPDWRGFGLTRNEGPSVDGYWFADYLADLDALLDHYAGERSVDLVGHSMGGNVAMIYAGVRPARIRRLVNLEGFGMPATKAAQAPGRYGQWLDELRALRQGQTTLKHYDSADQVARRLMKTNPRLPQGKADWLARQWAEPDEHGRWHILGDPAHKVVSAHLYRADEALEVFRRIEAPMLSVTASDDSLGLWWRGKYTLADYRERIRVVPRLTEARIEDAGHMLHHDQPEALAQLLDRFLE
jgi:pimeloyl-ACP methyl ester carboxylesterase